MFADSGNLEGANGAAKVGSYDLAGQKDLLVLWFIEGDFNGTTQAADSFSKRFVLG